MSTTFDASLAGMQDDDHVSSFLRLCVGSKQGLFPTTNRAKPPGMELLSDGAMALQIRNHDWSSSSLGDASEWSAALHTAVRVCLASWRPMQLWWGPELVVIPNDASATLRMDHMLGRPAHVVWQAKWDELAPALDVVRTGETATTLGMTFTPLDGGVLVCHEEHHFLAALGHALRGQLSPIATTIGSLKYRNLPEVAVIERALLELVQIADSLGRAPREAQAPAVKAPAREIRLLLVEDNDDDARALKLALEQLGFTVALAHDAPIALTLARTFSPHYALLDLGLPIMDGYELAKRLTAINNVPVIAVTARALESDRDRSIAEGFAAHLVKPIDLARLVDLLSAPDQRA